MSAEDTKDEVATEEVTVPTENDPLNTEPNQSSGADAQVLDEPLNEEEEKEKERKENIKKGKKKGNLAKEEMEMFVKAQNWTTEEVCEWLQKEGVKPSVMEHFQRERIVGSDLNLMDKQDLIDMGLTVGNRIRVLRLLHGFKYSSMVAKMQNVIWEGTEWALCPCYPIFKEHYVLTKTTLTLRKDRCCGQSQDRIDLSQVNDVDWFQECLTSTIQLTSDDATSPYIEIILGRDAGKVAWQTINNAWELDQQNLANARFGVASHAH